MPKSQVTKPFGGKNTSRISHKKSRIGCGNCKLRRVKAWRANLRFVRWANPWQCDEQRPSCSKCLDAHMTCEYKRSSMAVILQSFHERTLTDTPFLTTQQCSNNDTILGMINAALCIKDAHTFQLGSEDLSLLHRFHNRTMLSYGAPDLPQLYSMGLVAEVSYVSSLKIVYQS